MLNRVHLTKRGATLGLIALGVADAVLIALAFQAGAGTGGTPEPLSRSTTTVIPTKSSTPSPTGSGTSGASTPTGDASSAAAATAETTESGPLLLVAVDSDHAWRARGGTCEDSGASLERTSDGGKTWTRVRSPLPMINRLAASDADTAFVEGGDEDCLPQERRTDDGGRTWAPGDPSTSWYVVPKHPRSVNGPGVGPSEPCGADEVQDLVAVPDGARVLCADGTVRATYSYGREWVTIARVVGAGSMDAVPHSIWLFAVRAGKGDCQGLEVMRVGKGTPPVACIRSEADPSATSLSLTTDGGWIAAGDTVWRSGDRTRWQETVSAP